MLLSITKRNFKPQGNATLRPQDLRVEALSSCAVMRIDPELWSGRGLDVRMHVELSRDELLQLREQIDAAIETLDASAQHSK